jgi:hypothetical protein
MITLTLCTVINDVTVDIQGEANDLDEIKEAWEAFILTTYQVKHGMGPAGYKDLDLHRQNMCSPVQEVP